MKTLFIVNPKSASGKTGRIWPGIQRFLTENYEHEFEVVYTEGPLHATDLARNGIQHGWECLVSVGGDGTLNEVLNGFFQDDRLIRARVVLGLLEIGTGADFIKSFYGQQDFQTQITRMKDARPRKIDVGRADFFSLDGEPVTRYFINILDFGIGGAVVERVNRSTKRLGGRISFLWNILATLSVYQNKTIRYCLDQGKWESRTLNNFIVANGRYFGGGLCPAPHAQLDDGLFDIVLFGNIGRLEAMTNLSSLRQGTHLENPKISTARARHIEATSEEAVFIDMDGEFVGQLPIKVSILPEVLPVLV